MSNRAVRVGVLGVVVAIGGFVACGAGSNGRDVTIASSSNPANVVIELRDDTGRSMGSCSGVLVSSSAVLTAGHCVVAAKQWVVSTLNGQQTANGAQVFTTWEDFESNWSHPMHSDIGVILLDQGIYVSTYPTLAPSLAPDGMRLSRVRRVDPLATGSASEFEEVAAPIVQGQEEGFPLAYGIDPSLAEGPTDTGGALYDPATDVLYGVVSGKGMSTGRFYVSRVDYLAEWVSAIGQCDAAPRTAQCHPSSSGGSGSGGSTSSSSNSSSGGSSSGCSGSSSSSSGSGGSNGSSGSGSSSGGGGCNPPSPPPPPSYGGDAGWSSSGSSGGSSNGGSSNGGYGGSTSSSSGAGGAPPLIPDGPGCITAWCGGCKDNPACQDNQQDYGNCGCTPNPPTQREAGPNQ
jgi:uncharacterized membrane protein YgcG